jgi:hypothetical protein
VVLVLARRREWLEHRSLGLPRLEKQGIVTIAPHEQRDVRAGPDAADISHLSAGVDISELLEQVAAIVRETLAVVGENPPQAVLGLLGPGLRRAPRRERSPGFLNP